MLYWIILYCFNFLQSVSTLASATYSGCYVRSGTYATVVVTFYYGVWLIVLLLYNLCGL